MKKTLIVIDMQNDFIDGSLGTQEAQEIVKNVVNKIGEYEPENFELTDIEVHFELSGQIHKQIKDLPDGTNVKIVTE